MIATVKPSIPTELQEQITFFNWAKYYSGIPELELMRSSLEGVRLPPKLREICQASGMKKGFPDMHLPIAMKGFHSLYIELKRIKRGSLSPDQKRIIPMLRDRGNCVEVCKGAEAAVIVTLDYLEIPDATARIEEFRKLTQVPHNA